MIRLAEFITANHEPILVQWEAFARTGGAANLNTTHRLPAQAKKGKGRASSEQRAAMTFAVHLPRRG